MTKPPFVHGLSKVGDRSWAYLQPDGSWGYSNAGLIELGDQSLLIDTLFDLQLTRVMLTAMQDITRRRPIRTLVNTHANGDHCWGNQLVENAEIIASRAAAAEMRAFDPQLLSAWLNSDDQADAARFMRRVFKDFRFDDIVLTPPTREFDQRLDLTIDAQSISLIEVGPAHTRGDVIVHLPGDRVVYTGDILFVEATPIVWAGPISNWIRACDALLALDVDQIVPGHGPITDKAGVRAVREYLEYVDREATLRFHAGMSVIDAARDIALNGFSTWSDRERIAVNVHTKYAELRGPDPEGQQDNPMDVIALMQRYG